MRFCSKSWIVQSLFGDGCHVWKTKLFTTVVSQRGKFEVFQMSDPIFSLSILGKSLVYRTIKNGKMVHCCVLKSGLQHYPQLRNMILHMYGSCGEMNDALQLFEEIIVKDIVSWNTMISGFIGSELFLDSLRFYKKMKMLGMCPSQSTFASILVTANIVNNLGLSRQIHCEVFKCGLSTDIIVSNALMNNYLIIGEFADSEKLFYRMRDFDEASLEIMLKGYMQQRCSDGAFKLFNYSHEAGISFSHFAFSSLISYYANLELIFHGFQLHGYLIKTSFSSVICILNSLITMYSRCGYVEDATHLFQWSHERDRITWNSLMSGFAYNERGDDGLILLGRFLSSGMRMNDSTFSTLLSLAATITCFKTAKMTHALILKMRECVDQGTDNVVLSMYRNCNNLDYINSQFTAMKDRDIVTFNIMIGFFMDQRFYENCIELSIHLWSDGLKGNEVTYSNILYCCGKMHYVDLGHIIHGRIVKNGFQKDGLLENSLLGMYSQCGTQNDMEELFHEMDAPDITSWNMMIMGSSGSLDRANEIWEKMKKMNLKFNEFSYSAIINACDCLESLKTAEQVQTHVVKSGLSFDTVLMNSLLTMYSNLGMMNRAFLVFEEIPFPDSVSWNAMISGCTQNGFIEESVSFYLWMNQCGLIPDDAIFLSITRSCAFLADFMLGSQFHGQVIKRGFESDISLTNSLITMYSKCGCINDAIEIFKNAKNKDLITWNSMIGAYANYGLANESLDLLSEMKARGLKPNNITIIGILSACSHAGLVSDAWLLFNSMLCDWGMSPCEEHYACMIDILCRAGQLDEAKNLIESMTYVPSLIWRTLLSACRLDMNVDIGEMAARSLQELEPFDSSSYVLLCNIYDLVEKREKKVGVWNLMKQRGVKKQSGYSWVWNRNVNASS